MCGIAGLINRDPLDSFALSPALELMINQIIHRGPDSHNVWLHPSKQLGLGHTRLAILDLTVNGIQPMQSESRNFTISYNGEIYNHLQLRKDLGLSSKIWKGTSDTETLLACIEAWGLDDTLCKVHGMFAFALWDEAKKKLFLCRDRFGEKPLYYGWASKPKRQFIFSSELQSIQSLSIFDQKLNIKYIDRFLKTNNFGGDQTIYDKIYKVLPGSYVEFNLTSMSFELKKYWSSYERAAIAKDNPFDGTYKDAVNELEILLNAVISDQMISDVPIGCFLSGGLDSSLVASIMAAQSSIPINTFSIGQHGPGNEAEKAKKIAESIGANHTEQFIDADTAIELIPNIFDFYGEPFADSSQIPTFLVSMLAKKKVTVALSGDAGDEIFGGYNRYEYAQRYWPKIQSIPVSVRSKISKYIQHISFPVGQTSSLTGIDLKWENISLKLQKVSQSIHCENIFELHDSLLAPSHPLIQESIRSNSFQGQINPVFNDNKFEDFEKMMIADLDSYLSDDILVKVDRAAMRNSLETRVPFLDHRIFEFMWSLPPKYKIHKGKTKMLSRSVLSQYLSNDLFDQPKTGFGMPIGDWLRGPLKSFASDILFDSPLNSINIIDLDALKNLWKEHNSKKYDHSSQIWSLISLAIWLKKNKISL